MEPALEKPIFERLVEESPDIVEEVVKYLDYDYVQVFVDYYRSRGNDDAYKRMQRVLWKSVEESVSEGSLTQEFHSFLSRYPDFDYSRNVNWARFLNYNIENSATFCHHPLMFTGDQIIPFLLGARDPFLFVFMMETYVMGHLSYDYRASRTSHNVDINFNALDPNLGKKFISQVFRAYGTCPDYVIRMKGIDKVGASFDLKTIMPGYEYVKDLFEMGFRRSKLVCTAQQAGFAKDLGFDTTCGALLTDDMMKRIESADGPSSLNQMAKELSYRIIYYLRLTEDFEMYKAFSNCEIVDREILEQLCVFICQYQHPEKLIFGKRELKLFEMLDNRYSYLLLKHVDPNVKPEILKRIASMSGEYGISSPLYNMELMDVLQRDDVKRFDELKFSSCNSLDYLFRECSKYTKGDEIRKRVYNPKRNMGLVRRYCRERPNMSLCQERGFKDEEDVYNFVKDLTLDPEYNRLWRQTVFINNGKDFSKYKFPDNDQVKERINFIVNNFNNLKHYIGRILIDDIAPEYDYGPPTNVTFVDCILLDEILFKFIQKSQDEKLMDAYLAHKSFHEVIPESKD